MTNRTRLVAQRDGSDFDIFEISRDGFRTKVGRLADCEWTHVFVSDDEDLAEAVNEKTDGDFSIRERLEVIRTVYEAFQADYAALAHHERLSGC